MTRILALAFGFIAAVSAVHGDDERAFISPGRLAIEAHRYTPTSPDLLGDPNEPIIPLQERAERDKPCATIFGYLPYWESSTYLRYDLLTHIACFSVAVNSDGSLGEDRGWPWTGLINAAHQRGVKIVLVATLFEPSAIETLVTTPAYKNNFFVNIKNKMLEGSADGLNVDFEGSGTVWKAHINTFMAELTAYLHTEIPGSEVTFAGPAVNWGDAWDLAGLAASCDGIFIMGYAFYGSWSSTSGPNAPLTGGSINITDTVLNQYGDVTQNNPEKLILGVPYYGHHWTTVTSAPYSTVTDFVSSTRFRNDEPDSQTYGLLWDAVSQTPWYRWHDGSDWHQVWFDNADSLGLKYQLAQDHNLQGVGMWALGYDGDRTELWDELERRFDTCHYCAGDIHCDGDIDTDDYVAFADCMNGPIAPPTPTPPTSEAQCLGTFDFDDDLHVTQKDFAALQQIFTGDEGYCRDIVFTGFEGYSNGTEVLFNDPRYSGSTDVHLELTPNVSEVTDEVGAFGGAKCYKLEWQFIDTSLERWMRATSSNADNVPNPTIELDKPIRLRLRLDSGSLRVSLGVRETGTTALPGDDGGTAGTIEWVGADSQIGFAPQGKLISASPGVWQTVLFDPQTDPILGFTGDGVLNSPTNKGTLEHVAFSSTGGAGPFTIYIDDVESICDAP
ncbi:MAG: hypothetical protein JSV19_01515 [Phycisphaerales bacterium]|nr:MAG: hypothetical protein JSV19_01515 [Phycisphaerales bacterium]